MSFIGRKTKTEKDGKLAVFSSPATEGRRTFFVGAGDDLSPTYPNTGKGEGPLLRIEYDGTETGAALDKFVLFNFKAPVEIHDGELSWSPISEFNGADRFHFKAEIKQSIPTANPGSGNLNALVDFPAGHNLQGATRYQCNLDDLGSHSSADFSDGLIETFTQVYPVPTSEIQSDGTYKNVGYWEMDELTGNLTPNHNGLGGYDLVNAGVVLDNYIVRNVGLGSPQGMFGIDSSKVELLHHSWDVKMVINKDSVTNPCEVNVWILCFRAD